MSALDHLKQPCREAAQERLQVFVPSAGAAYTSRRNYDYGPAKRENTSCLSPYLRYGVLKEHEVISTVLEEHSLGEAGKFVDEVLWRTYWKGWLELRPQVWHQYREECALLQAEIQQDSGRSAFYQRVLSADSGIECVDQWIEELYNTGYLHNHARMWFASIWIFTLKLPWQLGAELFLRNLLDGDPASNTLSWRWIAGLHTKGKHYAARSENIRKFTQGRLVVREELNEEPDPIGEYATYSLQPLNESEDYFPAFAAADFLLVTTDDLLGDGIFSDLPKSLPTLLLTPERDEGVSNQVHEFRGAILKDALGRLSRHFDSVEVVSLGELSALLRKNRGAKLTGLCPYVGSVRDALEGVVDYSALPLRQWDAVLFPRATHGYFRFRKGADRVIQNLLNS